MPSLLVQLEGAAKGTGIRFTKIAAGERTALEPPAAPAATAGTPAPRGHPARAPTPAASRRRAGPERARPGGRGRTTPRSAAAVRRRMPPPRPRPARAGCRSAAARRPRVPTVRLPRRSGGLETVPLEMEFIGDFFQPRGLLPRHQALRPRREQGRDRERPPRDDRQRELHQRPDALPAHPGRDQGDRVPVAEDAGRNGRRDARRVPRPPLRPPRRRPRPHRATPSPAPTATATPIGNCDEDLPARSLA